MDSQIDLLDVATKLDHFVPMPEILAKVMRELSKPECNSATLDNFFKNDPNLSLEILKLANSAYYGMPGKITNIRSAIVLLGLKQIKSLVLQTLVSNFLSGDFSKNPFSGMTLWKHSVGVGVCARMICRRLGLANSEDYFTMGVVHDIGLFIEHRFYPESFLQMLSRVFSKEGPIIQIERDIFGTDHTALTNLLCDRWNIPKSLSQVMFFHHTPFEAPAEIRIPAAVIYMANYLTNKQGFGFHYPDADFITPELHKTLGLEPIDIEIFAEDFTKEMPNLDQWLNA